VLDNERLTQNTIQEPCQLVKLFSVNKNTFQNRKKIHCIVPCLRYSLPMQANSLITDDFNTQIQSDEFASEYEAWLDSQELKYWQEIDARGN
jgi:hypothetical protein